MGWKTSVSFLCSCFAESARAAAPRFLDLAQVAEARGGGGKRSDYYFWQQLAISIDEM